MSRTAIGFRPSRKAKPQRAKIDTGLGDTMLRFTAQSAGYQMVDLVRDLDDELVAVDVLIDRAVALRVDAIFVDGGRSAFRDPQNREILADKCRPLGIQLFY